LANFILGEQMECSSAFREILAAHFQLPYHAFAHRQCTTCDDMRPLKLGNVPAVARYPDPLSNQRLQIHAGRRRNEGQHLAALVHKRERRCARAT
jgi:hypothetical protein